MKTLIKDLKLVINSTEFKNDEIQIEQLLTDFIKQDRAEQLILSGVSQQRELLIAYNKNILGKRWDVSKGMIERDIDEFLSN